MEQKKIHSFEPNTQWELNRDSPLTTYSIWNFWYLCFKASLTNKWLKQHLCKRSPGNHRIHTTGGEKWKATVVKYKTGGWLFRLTFVVLIKQRVVIFWITPLLSAPSYAQTQLICITRCILQFYQQYMFSGNCNSMTNVFFMALGNSRLG